MTYPYLDNEPIVPLEMLSKSGEWIEFHAYIDSGAGYSVFHSDHAEILGLKIKKGHKIFFTVGDGTKILAYIHKVEVKFAGKKFLAEIAFSKDLGIGTNLLGLTSFFDKFVICFNHSQKKVGVEELI